MRIKKAIGSLLVVFGLFFIFISLVTFSATYVDPMVHIFAFFIFIISIISVIVGIILFRSGNAEIRAAKVDFERENQAKINRDKDKRIKDLEKRLDKVEKDKSE